jgi:DNA-binding NtrC family response regulator
MAGQPIQVVTLDPTTHNVHFMPKINREWNVTQEPGSASVIHEFTQPEIMIPVHCNIHPWMKAYVGVVSNQTPVVAVSRIDNWDSYLLAIAAGAFDCVDFPPYPGELERTLLLALKDAKSRTSSARAVAQTSD